MTTRTMGGCGRAAATILAAACGALGAPAHAGNGLNLIGFGAESIGMGGADIALGREVSGININPAGLSQIPSRRLDAYALPFFGYNMRHEDALNERSRMDNPWGLILGGGYAWRARPDLVAGVGVFAQGGNGIQYEKLQTVFGTRDEATAIFGATKLVGGLAWQPDPRWALGANLGLTYSMGRQKLFPETSAPGDPDTSTPPFFGLRFDGGAGFSLNGRVGILHKPSPNFTWGFTYASPTKLKLEDGTLTVNYEAIGLPATKYRDAKITGFELPQEVGAGFAWRFQPLWLFAMDVMFLDWSGSIKSTRVIASDPTIDGAPADVDLSVPLDYRDQVVLALGLAIDVTPRTTVRFGANISRNPAPAATMQPTGNLIERWEVDAGFTHRFDESWELAMGLQYQPPDSIAYDSPLFDDAKEHYGVTALTIQLSRHW
ncbi:MAG TPA: outer membrane protein transport protein [Nevskiaceae bacterium]|nr:outer membrane protein transport protein [Nevskiaceae bacterium]